MIRKKNTSYIYQTSFRPLNSEIGNDPKLPERLQVFRPSFRLLNSEIGNDLRK